MLIPMLQGQIVFFAKEHISSVFHTLQWTRIKTAQFCECGTAESKTCTEIQLLSESLIKEKDYAAETNVNTNVV